MTTKAEKQHMNKIAQLGCAVCWRLHGPHEPAMVELHHSRRGTGMGQRSSNMDVIGLCVEHHRGNSGIHGLGTRGFEKTYGFNEADLLKDTLERL
jgi:hypothetical protein